MSRVRGKDTTPEMTVRKIAHRLGLRFRLHAKRLPGCPDLVFAKHKTIVFVHGCFWHRHTCRRATTPKTHTDFWISKFERNQERDRKNINLLRDQGWKVLVVWECETHHREAVEMRLRKEFGLNIDKKPFG